MESVTATTVVASVRNATTGLGIDESSVAPLAFERWTLTLNGFVTDFRPSFMRAFRSALPDDLYGHLTGSSDTETLFMLLVARLREGASPGDALRDLVSWTVERVSDANSSAQLNLALTDGEGLWVTRAGSLGRSNSLYYSTHWRHAPGGVVIASEPLGEGDWTAVEDQTLVSVVKGEVLVEPL